MRFVKEAIKLGVLMFAGQLVCDGLTRFVKQCTTKGCCQRPCQEISEKDQDKPNKRKR